MTELAARLDQTLLRPGHGRADLFAFVSAAAGQGYASLCVCPASVAPAREILAARDPTLRVGTVVGFPAGFGPLAAKVAQAEWAVAQGAAEIDYVVDQTEVAYGRADRVLAEAEAMVALARERGVLLKAILECGSRPPEANRELAALLVAAGVDFLKTSTGVYSQATVEEVALLCEVAGGSCLVKAAGGIATREQALAMVAAGADRLGTSNGAAILADSQPSPARGALP